MPAPKQTKVKFPRAKATKIIKKVEKHLKPFVDRQMACGSYRRGAQMIGDIDFVVIPKEGVTLPQMLPPNEGINWVGDNKAQVVIDGEKVDFKVTTPEAWGATILYFTGPADFNIKYRWMAKKRGMKLNEYGLWDRTTDAYIAGATEQDIYDALKRPFRDPDQRTGWKRAENVTADSSEILLHPYGARDEYIDLLEEFPNAKNLDALISHPHLGIQLKKGVTVLNSMEELLAQDFHPLGPSGMPLYYVNFPLTVYRGVWTKGDAKQWTWKRWLDGNKMGASNNMGVHDSQPTTLNIQEALQYAGAGAAYQLDRSGFELYSIDIQDYFVMFPRPSQPYYHHNCNPDIDRGNWGVTVVSCDNPNHLKTDTPVIFILGGALYEDMQVIWDADVNASYFEAPYQPNSLKYGQTTLSAEDIWDNFLPGANFNPHDDPNYPAEDDNLPCDSSFEDGSSCKGSARTGPMHWSEGYLGKVTACRDCWDAILQDLEDNFTTSDEIGPHWQTPTGFEESFQEDWASETFGSENQWIVDNLTMLLTQRARTLSELIDDLGIRGITVESNLVRLPNFVRVGKHVPAVWGLAGQDYSRKHPYNAISPAAGRKQHLKTMFEKLDPRELDWDDDVTWNQKNEPDWSDEVSWDAEGSTPRCPICFGFIPNNANPGAYPGALSRYDNATEICSACGQAEGMSGLFLGSVDKDKIADMETITDPWLRHTYLINLVKDTMPAAFRGE